jgi:hypothetical protein
MGIKRRHIQRGGAALAVLLSVPLLTPAHAGLVNPGFELPALTGSTTSQQIPGDVPGWNTDESSIEIWANNFSGVPAYEGNQHAEINGNSEGSLFQEVTGIAAGQ